MRYLIYGYAKVSIHCKLRCRNCGYAIDSSD